MAARQAAEQWLVAGDPAAGLAELEGIAGGEASAGDCELLLLRGGCLIGTGKTREADSCMEAARKAGDLTCDRLARADLMSAAILVQQGRAIEARRVLDGIGQLAADAKYKVRAKTMLEKLE